VADLLVYFWPDFLRNTSIFLHSINLLITGLKRPVSIFFIIIAENYVPQHIDYKFFNEKEGCYRQDAILKKFAILKVWQILHFKLNF